MAGLVLDIVARTSKVGGRKNLRSPDRQVQTCTEWIVVNGHTVGRVLKRRTEETKGERRVEQLAFLKLPDGELPDVPQVFDSSSPQTIREQTSQLRRRLLQQVSKDAPGHGCQRRDRVGGGFDGLRDGFDSLAHRRPR
jgi:hypothetical protein